jgi:hypothetical protein
MNTINLGDLLDNCAVPFITFVIGQLLPQLKLGGILDAFRIKTHE